MATAERQAIRRIGRGHATAAEATDARTAARRLSWQSVAFIAVFGATLLTVNLGGRALTYHEVLFAQPAREMVASGDFLLPRIVDQPYVDKPPATSWAIAASMALLGRTSEAAARLPSVLAALGIALLVATVGARWFDGRVGVVAACVQLTSVYALMQARLAESDMLLAAAVTAAWAAMALTVVPRPAGMVAAARSGSGGAESPSAESGLLAAGFYAAAGAAFLIKGPIGPAMIFGGGLTYALVARRRAVWRWFWNPVGLGLLVACLTLWPMAAWLAYPPIVEAWRAHHWGRFTGELGGREPPGFYLYTSLWLMLPWTPALVWAVVKACRRGLWREPVWQFVVAFTAPGLLLLSLSSFQHKHYVIPLLPPLALATALGLIDYVRWRNLRPWPKPGTTALLAAVAGAIAIYGVIRSAPPAAPAIVAVTLVVGAGVLWLVSCEARREPALELRSMLALAWIGSLLTFVLVMPSYDSYASTRQLGREVDKLARRDAPTFLVGLPDHPVTFYVTEPLNRIDDPRAFVSAADRLRPVTHVLAPARCEAEFRKLGHVRTLAAQATLQSYLAEADRPTLFRITQR